MLTDLTLTQLRHHPDAHARADELARMGYMQWLAGLPARAPYADAARRTLARAAPFEATAPALAAFCDLVRASLAHPLAPLDLSLPAPRRRGGTRIRRIPF